MVFLLDQPWFGSLGGCVCTPVFFKGRLRAKSVVDTSSNELYSLSN